MPLDSSQSDSRSPVIRARHHTRIHGPHAPIHGRWATWSRTAVGWTAVSRAVKTCHHTDGSLVCALRRTQPGTSSFGARFCPRIMAR